MKHKYKLIIFILFLILMTLVSICSAFALTDYRRETIETESESFPYYVRIEDWHDMKDKDLWLYDFEIANSKREYTLSDGTKRVGVGGQFFYWTVPSGAPSGATDGYFEFNSDTGRLGEYRPPNPQYVKHNPWDYSRIRDPAYFNAMFAVTYNRENIAGQSWINIAKQPFKLNYPQQVIDYVNKIRQMDGQGKSQLSSPLENWNFKHLSQDPISKIFQNPPDPTALILNYDGIIGGPRYVFNAHPEEDYNGFISIATDIPDYTDYEIEYSVLVQLPHLEKILPMDQGAINVQYQFPNGSWRKFPSETVEEDKALFNTYKVFEAIYGNKGLNALMARTDLDKDGILDYSTTPARPKGELGAAVTPQEKVMRFLNYFELRYHASATSYGSAQLKRLYANGDLVYSSIYTPKIDISPPGVNLQVGGANGKTLGPNWRNYGLNIWEQIEGQPSVQRRPTESKLIAGKDYVIHSYVGFQSRDADIETFHSDIKTNIFIGLNDEAGIEKKDIVLNRAPDYQLLTAISSIDQTPMRGKIKAYSDGGGVWAKENILDYRTNITIPKTDSKGNPVTKITIYSHLANENNFYQGTTNEENDNTDRGDDFAAVTFDVGTDVDLKVGDIKIYDKTNKLISLDTELKLGEEYRVEWTVANASPTTATNNAPIGSGLSSPFKSETWNYNRDESCGTIYNPIDATGQDAYGHILKNSKAKYSTTFKVPSSYPFKSATFTVYTLKKYDGVDNTFDPSTEAKMQEDVLRFTIKLLEAPENNLAITGLDLIDSADGKVYSDKNDSGFYDFKINRRYNIRVKAKYTGETLPINNPEVNLKVINGDGSFSNHVLRADNYKNFTKSGDELTFTMNGYPYNDTRLTLTASIPSKYSPTYNNDFSDDEMTKTWINSLNMQAKNFKINPANVSLQPSSSKYMSLGFSIDLVLQNFSDKQLDNVQFVIKDARTGSIVYRDNNIVFSNNQQQIRYQGVIKNYPSSGNFYLQEGNNPFEAVINYDKKYKEDNGTPDPYKDNIANANVNVKIIRPTSPVMTLECNMKNTSANWSQTFYLTKKTGSLESKEVTRTRCSGSGENRTCESYEVTVYYCDNVSYSNWEETRSYTETFKITAVMFKSQSTVEQYGDTFINILGNNKGVVRAGQWYEFYIVTNYKTNRTDMPATSYSNECNYVNRTPGVSSVSPSRTPQYIDMRIYGYGPEELYKYVTPFKTTGSWSNSTKHFRYPDKLDIFGDTYTRRYIPTTGKDGTINIYVVTYPFDGYYFDELHPDRQFQDCGVVGKIYIKDQLPIQTQIEDETQ